MAKAPKYIQNHPVHDDEFFDLISENSLLTNKEIEGLYDLIDTNREMDEAEFLKLVTEYVLDKDPTCTDENVHLTRSMAMDRAWDLNDREPEEEEVEEEEAEEAEEPKISGDIDPRILEWGRKKRDAFPTRKKFRAGVRTFLKSNGWFEDGYEIVDQVYIITVDGEELGSIGFEATDREVWVA